MRNVVFKTKSRLINLPLQKGPSAPTGPSSRFAENVQPALGESFKPALTGSEAIDSKLRVKKKPLAPVTAEASKKVSLPLAKRVKNALFGLGLGTVGMGLPTALGIAAAQSWMSGNYDLGLGLSLATAVAVPIGLLGTTFNGAILSNFPGREAICGLVTGAVLGPVAAGLSMLL